VDASVLYVASAKSLHLTAPALLQAQQYALQQQLPLAVLFCVPRPKTGLLVVTTKLYDYEAQLKAHNIPLIVLIGNKKQVLDGAYFHLKPQAVFTNAQHYSPQAIKLVAHPIVWAGTVIALADLDQAFARGTC
jgi:hypothetical protein